jgi:MinD-like ATPase involved in chromosome partitioning or flagellar assembly
MSVFAIASVRSCGVTTLTAGLAMVWPGQRQRLVVEADPAGGMLAAASGLPPEPGLVSLAAATRRHDEPTVAFEHCQSLPGGTPILCGPPTSERARSALTMLSGLLGRLGELDADVFVDCGRFEPAASNAISFERADLGVLVVRPRLADLHALGAFLQGRNNALARATLVLFGPGPYPPAEVGEALGLDVAGFLGIPTQRRRWRPLRWALANSPARRWCALCARWPTTSPAGSFLGPGGSRNHRAIP